jgi:8-oxo-dGTP pyrophosphatase MutT (NUDIX family)
MRNAAVAAIMRERSGSDGAELLLIRRAENPRDPWSGHMALPGGHVHPGEPLRDAAVRETREEIGVDLDRDGRLLGRLSSITTLGRAGPAPMLIHPFVFALDGAEPVMQLSDEVAAVCWAPLRFLLDRANRSTLEWTVAGPVTLTLPCYRWEGNVLWGLTLRMVDDLLARIA